MASTKENEYKVLAVLERKKGKEPKVYASQFHLHQSFKKIDDKRTYNKARNQLSGWSTGSTYSHKW
jgi:hypothetical protein